MTGSILAARYQLLARLGEGGMGEVWEATHLLTGRAVAIKQLHVPGSGKSTRDARARFLLEAQSACAVDHPNVVQVFDFVEAGDEPPFIVMELLKGETLAAKLARESALSLAETARLILPLVSAVGTAHARGIIHRDLKPSNIFLCQAAEGRTPLVKVLDFGIAKWLQGGRLELGLHTQTGSTLGTPSYMSPEQATAERGVDHRTDIWSIGVILYECLSGARPVEGENAAQMVMRLLSSGIIPIERLVPSLPESLSGSIGRMLAREPAQRPPDLQELFELLCRLSGDQAPRFAAPAQAAADASAPTPEPSAGADAQGATPLTTWVPATRPPARDAGADAVAGSSAPRSSSRRRWLTLAFALAGLVLAAVLGLRPRSTPGLGVNAEPGAHDATPSVTALTVVDAPEPGARVLTAGHSPPAAGVAAAAPAATVAPATAAPTAAPAAPRAAATNLTNGAPARRPAPRASKPGASAPPLPAAPARLDPAASAGLPRGADCDRSSQCASRICVAYACQ